MSALNWVALRLETEIFVVISNWEHDLFWFPDYRYRRYDFWIVYETTICFVMLGK
jgi:hypothetical protein